MRNEIPSLLKIFTDNWRRMAGSMILNFTYGIDTKSIQDPFMVLVEKTMQIVSMATIPGMFLVDTIHACS